MEHILKIEKSHRKIQIPKEIREKINPENLRNRLKINVVRGLSVGGAMLVFLTGCSGVEKYNKEAIEPAETKSYTEGMDSKKTIREELSKLIEGDSRIKTYEALENELKIELDKKNFSDTANEMIKQILDNIYKNYDEWELLSVGMPDKYDYIRANLIDVITKIGYIKFNESESERSNELRENGTSTAMSDGENIEYIYVPQKDEKGKYSEFDLETLFHEVQHIKQNTNKLYYILIEGGATYHMRMANAYKNTLNSGMYYENNGLEIHYTNEFEARWIYFIWKYL